MKKEIIIIILFLYAISGCSTYTGYSPYTKNDAKDNNIILISIDTLRADHLPCYGYYRNTAPAICDFSKDGVLFENAFVQMPLTGPSHASILSSRYPDSHGLLMHESVLNENVTFLSQLLKDHDYYTGAFVNVFRLDSRFGFDRGFDTFSYNKRRNAQETNKLVFEWLENNKDKKFFLWVHYFDPHFKYDPPYPYNESFSKKGTKFDLFNNRDYLDNITLFRNMFEQGTLTKEDLNRAVDLYDGEIKFVDDRLRELFNYLKSNNLYDNSMIILTSDHGEGFDHDYYFSHGLLVYDSSIHVPLIIKFPSDSYRNTRISGIVESVDIAPTVLDYINMEAPSYFEGVNLLDYIANNKSLKRFAITQALTCEYPVNNRCFPKGYSFAPKAIRDKKWKLILSPYNNSYNYELYDLESDPGELFNAYKEHPRLVDELEGVLLKMINPEPPYNDSIELDQETISQLRSLGYIT